MSDTPPQAITTLTEANAIGLAWEDVDPDELAVVLRKMPTRLRNRMLSAVRVPSQKIGVVTAQLLLVNLRRRGGPDRFRVARTVTHPYADDLAEALDEAIGAGADPVAAVAQKAKELAEDAGPSVVALAAVSHAYSDPTYHVPSLVACAAAGLLGDRLAQLAASLRATADHFVEAMKTDALTGGTAGATRPVATSRPSTDGLADELAATLTGHWERAIPAAARLQEMVRDGRPPLPGDLAEVSSFADALWKAAAEVGVADAPSVALVKERRRARSSLALLARLTGPDALSVQLAELRDALAEATGAVAQRLERFAALVDATDAHERFAIVSELRQQPSPPAPELLDAAATGLLAVAAPTADTTTAKTPNPAPPAEPEISTSPKRTGARTVLVTGDTPVLPTETAGASPDAEPGRRGADTTTDDTTTTDEPPAAVPTELAENEHAGAPVVTGASTGAGLTSSAGEGVAQTVPHQAIDAPTSPARADLDTAAVPPPGDLQVAQTLTPTVAVEWTPATGEPDAAVRRSDATRAVCDLLRAQRFGLASHLARAADDEYHARVLDEAALAHAVRTPGSAAAAEMVHVAETTELVPADVGSTALRTASALRVALLDPGSGAPAVIQQLLPALDALPALRELAIAVAGPTGQMLSVPATGQELDAAAAIDEADAIANWARDTLARPPHQNRLYRGLEIWKVWAAEDGPLGRILSLVAANDPGRITDVTELITRFGRRQLIERAIDGEDAALRRHRAGTASRITGPAKAQLVRHVEEVIRQATAWCEAAARATTDDRTQHLRDTLVVALRPLRPRVSAELQALCREDWREAAADAARMSLMATIDLFFGHGLDGSELDPETARNRGLAFVTEVKLDDALSPRPEPTLAQLLAAARRSRQEAFDARVAAADFNAAELVIDALGPGEVFDPEGARRALAAAEREALPRVERHFEELTARFAAARAHGRLDEDRAAALYGELLAARPSDRDRGARRDLGTVDRELDDIERKLQLAVDERGRSLRKEFDDAVAEGTVSAAWSERIRNLLADDELGAAEEYLHRALANESAPPDEPPDDDVDLGMAIDSLAIPGQGLTRGIVDAVRSGTSWGRLDFSGLGEIDRDTVASALDAWMALRDTARPAELGPALAPVLRLLGIVPASVERPAQLRERSTNKWFFCDVNGDRSGYAFVPTFGSRAHGRRRVMICWEQLSPGQLWDTASAAALPDEPVYVLYMHLLSAEGRIALAREAMTRGTGKVGVIDDAVIAACAQAGKQSYEVTMRAVLPYASPNPYNPDLMADTPEEMFYGRRLERDKLVSFTGSAFISGGRRLGKTALLYAVRQQLERTDALALLVVIQHVAAATQDPTELWPVLGARLAEAGVIPSAPPYSLDSVTAGIRQWFAEDTDRRLMVLLDECDFFLRADAEKNFTNVVALRNLMMEPGSRFKVVFSGLQHVTRYLRLPNQPLSHLPQPIVIGPLDPSAASRLVRRPLRALGFNITEAQVDRIVTFCACNPSVIQLTCMELVERLQAQQCHAASLAPWPVDEAVLDGLLDSQELAGGVKERLFLTLNLDHRYKLLAYLVAYQALNEGLGAAASPVELRAQAVYYWPDGFSAQEADDVRALCDELVGLGVFAGDAELGYRMLSPATVRLFGTLEEVTEQLTTAYETYNPDLAAGAGGTRIRLDDDRFSPLTASQMADALAVGKTQLRIVLGSRALGHDAVIDALRTGANELGVDFVETNHLRTWKDRMTAPKNGHIVVTTDMATRSRESFDESVAAARRRGTGRTSRGSRAAVLVAGCSQRWLLDELATSSAAPGDLADLAIPLRRIDLKALAAWARIGEIDLALPAQQRRLIEVTGGWPFLVERILADVPRRPSDAVIAELAHHLGTPEGARELVAAVGLDPEDPEQPADPGALAVLSALVVNEWATDADGAEDADTLSEFLDELGGVAKHNAARGLAILELLGALERREDGAVFLEPVLAACARRTLVAPTAASA